MTRGPKWLLDHEEVQNHLKKDMLEYIPLLGSHELVDPSRDDAARNAFVTAAGKSFGEEFQHRFAEWGVTKDAAIAVRVQYHAVLNVT